MALDKFQPYLFVSAGEQSNKYLTPTITNGIAQFQAQREQSLTGLTVRIDPIQEGSGDPSPDNIRPISGRTGMTVTVQSGDTQNAYPISWQTEAGEVYGGTLDVVSGVLTVDRGYYTVTDADTPVLFQTGANANRVGVVVTGSAISPTAADRLNIMSNIAKADTSILTQSQQAIGTCCLYSAGSDTASKALFGVPTTEDTAAKAKAWLIAQGCAFVYPLATPQTYRFTGAEVRTIAGFNQVYSDAGPVIDIKF